MPMDDSPLSPPPSCTALSSKTLSLTITTCSGDAPTLDCGARWDVCPMSGGRAALCREVNMSKIIVIGSGFGGLAAAIRLAARGHDVEVFEKRDKLGGRAYVYDINGFKFDGGPTVITAPFMFDDLWASAGTQREDYVEFVACDP